MKKLTILLLFVVNCFGDTQPLSQAQQQQIFDSTNNFANQYQNSGIKPSFSGNSIDKAQTQYNQNAKFNINFNQKSNVYDNNGNLNSSVYDKYNRANTDNLYNDSREKINNCKSATDPECTTLTKLNDDDAMNTRHAYSTGSGNFYYRTQTIPDPSNETCSLVTKWSPVNETHNYCMVSNIQNVTCRASMSAYQTFSYHYCYDSQGQCEQYKNPTCTLVQKEIPWQCTYHYTVDMCAGGNFSGDWGCVATPTSTPPAITKTDGYQGGSCNGDIGSIQQIPGWGGCPWGRAKTTSKNCTETQPAKYSCTQNHYIYNDGCSSMR